MVPKLQCDSPPATSTLTDEHTCNVDTSILSRLSNGKATQLIDAPVSTSALTGKLYTITLTVFLSIGATRLILVTLSCF